MSRFQDYIKHTILGSILTWSGYGFGDQAALAQQVVEEANSPPAGYEQLEPAVFNIEVNALEESIKQYSEQTGISIIYNHQLVDQMQSEPVLGKFTLNDAMDQMLSNSGLEYKQISKNTWAIVEETPAVLPIIKLPSPPQFPKNPSVTHDEIIVTASYRTPFNLVGEHMLYTLEGEQLRLNGSLNIAEPIRELPASIASVSSSNTALLSSSAGLNFADLRGLGPERTLVLVNGRRYIRTSGGSGTIFGVDLNSIPTPFVDRIEIANQSAGASLGGDAVAGVINIVLRDNIDGIAITMNGGLSEQGDAEEYSASILAGSRFGNDQGHFIAGITYASEPSLLLQQRPRISEPYGFGRDGRAGYAPGAEFSTEYGGSTITPNGLISGLISEQGDVKIFTEKSDAQFISSDGQSFSPFEARPDQLYNWATDFSALPEIKRLIGYATTDYEFSTGQTIYAEAHFAQTKIRSQIASSPVAASRGRNLSYGDAILVDVSNPFVPSGLQSTVEQSTGESVAQFLLNRRFTELGPRLQIITRENFQVTIGAEGPLKEGWQFDTSYQFGQSLVKGTATGYANRAQLNIALNAEQCAATPDCTPINIFGSMGISPAQASFIRATPNTRKIKTQEQIAQLKISGSLYDNKGQNSYAIIGVEHRRETLNFEPLISFDTDQSIGDLVHTRTFGKSAVTEFLINTSFPLVVDTPWTKLLEFGGAIRHTTQHGSNSFSNFSGNLRWLPINGIELYAHALHGGRAPNVTELFFTGLNNGFLFFDPCDSRYIQPTGTVAENCASTGPLGVTNGFTQENSLALYENSGNQFLEEERINSQVFGITSSVSTLIPTIPGNLSISADWRRHHVENAISGEDLSSIISECYNSTKLSDFRCGTNPVTQELYIQRDPNSQQITKVNSILLNGGYQLTSGLDARLQYKVNLETIPYAEFFKFDLLYSYIHKQRSRNIFSNEEKVEEGLTAFPRHQLHMTAGVGTNKFKTVWTIRRRGKAVSTYDIDIPEVHIPSIIYVDASVQYRPAPNITFNAGIENLFNTEIPIVAFGQGGIFQEHYDVIGRRFFAGIKSEF